MRLRAALMTGWLAVIAALGCGGPAQKSSEAKPSASAASGASPSAPSAPGAPSAAHAASPPAAPGSAPKPDPSVQLQVARVYLFRGIGRGEGPASVLQQNLAESFTPALTDCARQHALRGRFGMMLLVKPEQGGLEVNGVKGPTQVPPPFVECARAVFRRAQMPEGERFDGMLMIDYDAR